MAKPVIRTSRVERKGQVADVRTSTWLRWRPRTGPSETAPPNATRCKTAWPKLTGIMSLFVAGTAGAFTMACTGDETRQRAQTIFDGTLAPERDAVVVIETVRDAKTSLCTGALIYPDLVLTAAHCVTASSGVEIDCLEEPVGEALSPDTMTVSAADDLAGEPQPDWKFYSVQRAVPLFESDDLLCNHDLAIVQLETPIPAETAEPLALTTDPLQAGDIVRAYGYGIVHPSGTGEGVRRVSSPLEVLCLADDCREQTVQGIGGGEPQPAPYVGSREFLTESAPCPGDSGGPALRQGEVVGVLSRGHGDCAGPVFGGDLTTAKDFVFNHALALGEVPPGWSFPVQESTEPTRTEEEEPLLISNGGAVSAPPGVGEDDELVRGGCSVARAPTVPRTPLLFWFLVAGGTIRACSRRRRRVGRAAP